MWRQEAEGEQQQEGGGGGGARGGADLEVGGAHALAQDVARHAAVEPGVRGRHLQHIFIYYLSTARSLLLDKHFLCR